MTAEQTARDLAGSWPVAEVPLRIRAARKVCRDRGCTQLCEMTQDYTDAVLAEVAAWLVEKAAGRDRQAAELGGSALAKAYEIDAQGLRNLAEQVVAR